MRFVDTSFWYALVSRVDRHHDAARSIASAGAGRLITTNLVLGETWTLITRRQGHAGGVDALDRIEVMPGLQVVHVGERTEREAWRWLRRHDGRHYSFVDATSFAVMRARRIREALAFDGDFYAAGFVEVRTD